MEKDTGLALDTISKHMGYIAQQIEKGEIDLDEGKKQIEAWKHVFYAMAKGKELSLKEKDVRVETVRDELTDEDKKIIDELIATIKTGLKALDKKPTKPKTTKGGGKRCQKK